MREQKRSRNYPIHHCDSITSSTVLLSHSSLYCTATEETILLQLLHNMYRLHPYHVVFWQFFHEQTQHIVCLLFILANPFLEHYELIPFLQGIHWFQFTCLRLVIHHSKH